MAEEEQKINDTIYAAYDERYIALQLAKEKQVDLFELSFSFSVSEYNTCNKNKISLTDGEYQLLKRNCDILTKEDEQ